MTVRRVVAVAVLVAAALLVWILGPWSGKDATKSADRGTAQGTQPGTSVASRSSIHGSAGSRRVAGTVLFDDGVAPPATVRLVSAISDAELASTRTDAMGRFDFGLVAPVAYVVVAEAPRATGAATSVDLRNPLAEPAPDALRLRLHGCKASIFGVVADASGGTIAKARVSVAFDLSQLGPGVDSQADGAYELCVPDEFSLVVVRADGYADTMLTVNASGRVHRDVSMSPEAIVAGRVVRADNGDPVPDAVVTLRSETFVRGGAIPWYYGTSDADGTFRLRGVAPGRYGVTAAAERLASEEATPVLTEVEAPADDVVCTVAPTLTLTGKVIDRQAKTPIAGATVIVLSMDPYGSRREVERGVTQADGTFVIEHLTRGEYSAMVSDYEMSPREHGLDIPAASPLVLEVDRLASIAGRVTRDGKPVDGASVMIQSGNAYATSGVDGQFVLRGLPPGDYHVYAESRRVGAFTKGPAVTVSAGEQKTGVEVEMELAGSIAGTVIDQTGAPVAGVMVRFSLLHGRDFGDATTAADGSFTASALSGGGDYIYAVYDATGSSVAYRPAGGKRFSPVSLENADTRRTGLRIQIQYDRLSISGRVLTSDGKPAPDVIVLAEQGMQSWSSPRATTDMTGRFTIKDLPAGRYQVHATSATRQQMVPDVEAGAKNVEIRFPSVGTIVGTFEGFAKPPEVTAHRSSNYEPVSYHADVKGQAFAIKNVPAGEYSVVASSKDGFARATVTVTNANASVVLKNTGVGTVEGHVIDSSTRKPMRGLMCTATGAIASSRTDDSGAFRIEGAPVGPSRIFCMATRASGRGEVVVSAGKTVQVEILGSTREPGRRSYSGLELGEQLDDIVVTAVAPGSPAERAGIKVDDFIKTIGGEEFGDSGSALRSLEYVFPGEKVAIVIERGDNEQTVTLQVTAPP